MDFDSGTWFGHPRGLNTLFFTEMWERFSYYGMRALLVLFMVAPAASGGLGFGDRRAGAIYGTYTMSVYMLCIPGGFIADNFLGARRAVFAGGAVIAVGHFTLALVPGPGFFAGLALIAIGTGLLKPNVSTMVGGLYDAGDLRRDAGFSIYYMGINLGAFAAPLVTGFLAQSAFWRARLAEWGLDPRASWHWGFAAAGAGMTIGLVTYVAAGRRIGGVGRPPAADAPRPWAKLALVLSGSAAFFAYAFESGLPGHSWMRVLYVAAPLAAIAGFGFRVDLDSRRIAAVFVFFLAAVAFWTIYEQAGSTLALFSDELTRSEVFGWHFPSAWFQSLNPLFVIALAPAFAWLWVALGRRQPASPVKFAFGLALLGLSFVLMVPAARLAAGGRVSPLWLVGVFFLQTLGELCLSPVGLSTMTKLAPARLAGLVMGVWFLADALGNQLAGALAGGFDASDTAGLAASFGRQALAVGACAAALLALAPWIRRRTGEV